MLLIRYGTDRSANSEHILREICENAKKGITRQILIVPEQISFDTECRLCQVGGDSICLSAEVLSFSRLATRVFSISGGAAVQTLDKSGRLIAMAGALEQVRSRLKLYGRQIAKPEFLLQLLDVTEEFKSYGVDTAAITRISRELSGSLAEKIEELRLIFESYDAVCENARQERADRLERLRQALEDTDYAAGRRIFIDGFSDFTGKELQVVQALLHTADSVSVSLCCDGLLHGQSVFAVPRETAAQLTRMAEQAQSEEIPPSPDGAAAQPLREKLFAAGAASPAAPSAAIRLLRATDCYHEGLFAVAEIEQLLLHGSRWREISIACTELSAYRPVLENLFAQYGIPAYFAGTRDVLREPVFKMVLSALDAASSGMEAETISEYLKSGMTPLTRDACDRLENYAFLWNLHGAAWDRAFTQNPCGYSAPDDEQTVQQLQALNQSRATAILPLTELKTALSVAKNTGEQILALNRFLEQIQLREQLQDLTAALTEAGELQRAQEYGQLYGLLIQTMEQIYGVLGKSIRTPDEFCRFLRAALSQQSVGTIPAAIDCVHVGAMSALRGSTTMHRIVLGASEGWLPHGASEGNLLSDAERRTLRALGLSMAPDAAGHLERELLCAYEVLTSFTHTLHISCRDGEQSYLFSRLCALYPDSLLKTAPQPLPLTVQQAAGMLAAVGASERQAIFAQLPQLREATQQLLERASYTAGTLREQTVQQLYGRQLRLSASKIDKYAACRYAYFLNYGLRAQERRQAAVDAPLFGTFVHYVLENTARQAMQEGGFAALTQERLLEIAQACIDRFTEQELNQLADKPEREAYLYRRSLSEVREVALELWQELRQSAFLPVGFELKFGTHEALDAVRVQGKKASCVITGAVDRVDLFRDGETTYVRVVDYKTGRKDFDYADLLCGIGLQMFIYLFALEQSGQQAFDCALTPAGVLYFPARMEVSSKPRKPSAEEAQKERRKLLRRKGLLLDDAQVLQAMEPYEKNPVYLPEEKNHVSAQRLETLRQYVTDTLADMTDRIFEGNIEPNPYTRGGYGSCSYCAFKQVCHVNSGEIPVRRLAATSAEKFWETLEGRGDGNGDANADDGAESRD